MTTLPTWQRGYDLGELKSFAAVFAERHRPLVHGAFGLTKERDIADALADNALLFKRGDDGEPVACAILHQLRTGGGFTDFAGRHFDIPAGSVRCIAFATLDVAAGVALLNAMLSRAKGHLWVEAFEEDTLARAAIEQVAQLAYIGTKIAAGSEVKGIYSDAARQHLPPLHPAERASLVVIDREFIGADERAAMLAEIESYAAQIIVGTPWAQHYSSYNLRKSWTAFALRGYDPAAPGFIIKPVEMARSWQEANPSRLMARPEWTAAIGWFPRTMAVVQRVLGTRPADRVRLMKLAPGGELARHADITDRDAGLTDGKLARLHLPLRTSPQVVMHGWDKRGAHVTTRFPPGALCYLDQRGPHRVENRDPHCERVHLVIDMQADAALRDAIAERMPDGLRAVA
jgi:hypothetical protein